MNPKTKNRLLFLLEEAGIVELIILICVVWLFITGQFLFSLFLSFLLGVALAYLVDKVSSRRGIERPYIRQEGLRRNIDEYGLIELLFLILTIIAYLYKYYVISLILGLVFGFLLVYFIDRTRIVRRSTLQSQPA